MSIATMQGDRGQTGLAGGLRISKADLRVEAYGTVDELNASLGFARSLCSEPDVAAKTLEIQRTLFRVGAALASVPDGKKQEADALPEALQDEVDTLTAWVHQIEAIEGILSDWSIPGGHTESAAYEVARTVCRRAERCAVRFAEGGGEVQGVVIPYLNRLSDLLWLFGRLIELKAGVDARLRGDDTAGPKWSRAWR
jgi:cob(I)alamin adenosyltransferase